MIADHVVVGERIHARIGDPAAGFVAIADGRIIAVEQGDTDPTDFIGPRTTVTDASAATVLPGFHDHHTFFTSQLLEVGGRDAETMTDADVLALVGAAADSGEPVFLRAREARRVDELIARIEAEIRHPDAVLLAHGPGRLALTARARNRVGHPDSASNESLHGIYAQLAADPGTVTRAFMAAARRMHRGGVVSVKDIAFDTHLGMRPGIDALLGDGALGLRYAFASQPVAALADLDAAQIWSEQGSGAQFQGFKLMTDGSFDEGTGDLLRDGGEFPARLGFDVTALEAEATRILDAGFSLALNADGDAAVRACVDVFDRYARQLPARCSISDASLLHDAEAGRLARLGVEVELYTQVLRYPGYDQDFLEGVLAPSQRERLGNLAALLDAGVVVASGSDFPLFEPSLPEAMLSSAERVAGMGSVDERWPYGRRVSRAAVARIWTRGGQMRGEPGAGRFLVGAPGDVVVFDRDLFEVEVDELAEATTALVLAAGAVVHAR